MQDNINNSKKFWMNLLNPSSKKEMDVVDKIKMNLTFVETIRAIISISVIVASQIEYEVAYYEVYYIKKNPDEYTCMWLRIVYSVVSAILSKIKIL
jgi:hypothetical protein